MNYEDTTIYIESYPGKEYFVVQKLPQTGFYHHMINTSDRIWCEDAEGKVSWAKNRNGLDTPVDLKEFMWVKLAAKPLNNLP